MNHADDLRSWARSDGGLTDLGRSTLLAAADYIEQLEAELHHIARECWDTGGEFWTGTADMDRLPRFRAMLASFTEEIDEDGAS